MYWGEMAAFAVAIFLHAPLFVIFLILAVGTAEKAVRVGRREPTWGARWVVSILALIGAAFAFALSGSLRGGLTEGVIVAAIVVTLLAVSGRSDLLMQAFRIRRRE